MNHLEEVSKFPPPPAKPATDSVENVPPFQRTSVFSNPSSPKALKSPCFCQNFCAACKILKKTGQKGVFRHFLEKNYQKIAFFFWRALPP